MDDEGDMPNPLLAKKINQVLQIDIWKSYVQKPF